MSKGALKAKAEKSRKIQAEKKARKKRLALVGAIAAAALIGVVALAFQGLRLAGAEVYGYSGQRVRLFADGRFDASLPHGMSFKGKYSKDPWIPGEISVAFVYGGGAVTGWIAGDMLLLPLEWDDGHGHAHALQRTR